MMTINFKCKLCGGEHSWEIPDGKLAEAAYGFELVFQTATMKNPCPGLLEKIKSAPESALVQSLAE
jgi:hypothetical protein